MDDIKISSATFEEHVRHCQLVFQKARSIGFEFKVKKAQWNQKELSLWGSVCGELGIRADPGKLEQLKHWPMPTDRHKLKSFLQFAEYLSKHLNPLWRNYEKVLAPFRKEKCDFSAFHKDPKYKEAFEKIRQAIYELSLIHISEPTRPY